MLRQDCEASGIAGADHIRTANLRGRLQGDLLVERSEAPGSARSGARWRHLVVACVAVFLVLQGSPPARADIVTDQMDNLRDSILALQDIPPEARDRLLSYLDWARQEYEGGQASPYSVMKLMEAFFTEFGALAEQLATPTGGGVSLQQDGEDEFIDQFVTSYFVVMSHLFFRAPETTSVAQPLPEPPESGCSAMILWRYPADWRLTPVQGLRYPLAVR